MPTADIRSHLLVDAEWLTEHLDDPSVRLIDCDQQELSFNREHIPGAVAFPIHPYFRNTDTGVGVATAEQAEGILRGLGVSADTKVVCYDSQGGLMAARVWWVLWYYGHDNAAVLDGGWNAWTEAGLPTTREWAEPAAGDWSATVHPDRIESCDTIIAKLGDPGFQTLDVRSLGEWDGTRPSPTQRHLGHIPGTIHIEWVEFVDWDNGARFKPVATMRGMLDGLGINPDTRIVPYCGGGIRAAHAAFILHLLGYNDVANYDRSWSEWGNRDDAPIARPA